MIFNQQCETLLISHGTSSKVIAPGIFARPIYIKCEHIYVFIRLHIKSGEILGIS